MKPSPELSRDARAPLDPLSIRPSHFKLTARSVTLGGLGAILLVSTSLNAGASNRALTWQESVLETGRNNSELRAARENLRALQYTREGANTAFLPTLNGSIDYSYGKTTSSGGTVGSATLLTGVAVAVDEAKSNYSLSLQATENLFNGFQDRAKVDRAIANVRASEATLDTTKAKLSFDLKSAYAGLIFAQRSVELQERIIERRKENLKLVSLRFQSGRENKGSVLLSKAYFNQAGYNSLQARNSIQVARTDLARILGRDEDTEIAVAEDVPIELPPANPVFKRLAVQTPDHRQAIAQEDAAEAALTIARSAFFPTIGLTANAGKTGQEFFPNNDRWSIGASASIPLYNGGRDRLATESASSSLSASAFNRLNTDRALIAKLSQSYTGYVESIERLKVDESFLEAALKRAEIARSKYNNGLMTFEDWDLIENDLIARETAVLQSQKDRATAEASWLQAQGQGVFR